LLPLIPDARYIYLGDTARLPYGSKSHETIARYAVSSARFLHEQGADLLVIACNTATALAFEDIQAALPIPVIGVVEPGAQAALQSTPLSKTLSFRPDPERAQRLEGGLEKPASLPTPVDPPLNQVLVLATAATVQSHAYTRAINALNLDAHEKACPLLVPLVEEGWTNHPVTDEVLRIYLTEALGEAPNAKTLLLGCTHYPLIEPAIRRTLATLNHPLTIIDSAEATARAVATHLHPDNNQQPTNSIHQQPTTSNQQPEIAFYATDSIEKFQRLGSNFLGQPVTEVNLIDLGG
jgi:glutamate racemase